MTYMRRLLMLFCLIFFSGIIYSQEPLTLEDAIATALKNNFDIQLVRTDSSVYGTDNELAWGAFLPRLNGSVNKVWNQNNQRQQLADGSKRELDNAKSSNLTASMGLSWTLFDGLRMFATKQKVEELVKLGSYNVKNQIGNTV